MRIRWHRLSLSPELWGSKIHTFPTISCISCIMIPFWEVMSRIKLIFLFLFYCRRPFLIIVWWFSPRHPVLTVQWQKTFSMIWMLTIKWWNWTCLNMEVSFKTLFTKWLAKEPWVRSPWCFAPKWVVSWVTLGLCPCVGKSEPDILWESELIKKWRILELIHRPGNNRVLFFKNFYHVCLTVWNGWGDGVGMSGVFFFFLMSGGL